MKNIQWLIKLEEHRDRFVQILQKLGGKENIKQYLQIKLRMLCKKLQKRSVGLSFFMHA